MLTVQQPTLRPRYAGLKVTREEYLALEDDGFKYDMIDGVLHVSPSAFSPHAYTRARDLGGKAERYCACGVREYWIADPDSQNIELWQNRGGNWDKLHGAEIQSALLPGFRLRVQDIFWRR